MDPSTIPIDFGGGKFGTVTGIELPPWLDERRGDCEILRYEERLGS